MVFGLGHVAWDQDPEDVNQLMEIMKAMAMRNTMDKWNVVLIINPLRYHVVHEALGRAGFNDIQKLTWCKSNAQTMDGTTLRFTAADETIVVAHYGLRHSASDCQVKFDNDPTRRFSWFIGPTQKTKLRHQSSSGAVVNVYEKPPWLAEFLAGHYVKPGDTCVVFGAGAGGDVKGLLNLGCDVIAFENDEQQQVAFIAEMMDYEPCKSPDTMLQMHDILNMLRPRSADSEGQAAVLGRIEQGKDHDMDAKEASEAQKPKRKRDDAALQEESKPEKKAKVDDAAQAAPVAGDEAAGKEAAPEEDEQPIYDSD